MPKSIIIAIIILLAIVVIFYVIAMVLRKQTENRILALEKRKEDLFDLPVQEEVEAVKKLHLVGQSQTIFREWNQKWIDLSANSFADLENHIFEAEQLNDSFRFIRARTSVDASESQIKLMEEDVQSIRDGISELTKQETINSSKIQDSLDLYDTLRSEISDNAGKYGVAITELQVQLKNIETEFTQFVDLNSTGDPIEASEVLETAEEHTIALGAIADRIPPLVIELTQTYPAQLESLTNGYEDFKAKDLKLPESAKVEDKLQEISDDLAQAMIFVENFELDRADAQLEKMKLNLDGLYETFSEEYKARRDVANNANIIKDYLAHTRTNNKNLLLEIDHVSQNYILTGNEMGLVRGFQEELETLDSGVSEILDVIKENAQPYSLLGKEVDIIISTLDDIEKNQVKISSDLQNLRKQEKAAQDVADTFDREIRILKRYVEKRNLPGLPQSYLDKFFATSERVQTLFKELNKVKVNIDGVNHLVDVTTEDVANLKDATDEMVDNARLAEDLMQYANRYKTTNERVAKSIAKAYQLFERDRNYTASFEEISVALDEVEPGASERISNVYYNTKPTPDYR
ncbi:septation ring formation regulator EzrA [Lactococcus piscium]|uniref:Septation ring formation regulator EzrA n=1 Tax=Pseudolactococcus paracarnosus TaxID=2749962 RepID=A0A7L4WHA7_9LACT|nr:septation ring formation regulator EzrA [Lactococcus paracarnosus]SPC36902.1 Septation ring formation regulator EzrA [Lactococcus piscium]MCJ1976875.1 septation ring formation regulator EzrA [Lactococcus paracarnosus]MCJ1982739.1 septation ring formation regulator EzrA [Lactococcus paracarnosus]MCJ1994874.1 septation ring formation regulator EzrA [Lactococcus paracarnosus]QDJ28883.1 septation ring formation regulator EzrA [Lactococcus paracarnosus]